MSEPPEAARRLVLDLVRPQVEARGCPACAATLRSCRLDLAEVRPDRIEVVATCPACGAPAPFQLRPAADGGAASIR